MNKAESIAGQIDALAALREEKAQVKLRINASSQRLGQIVQRITDPIPSTTSVFSIGSLVSNGVAIYQGVRLGTRLLRSITSIFHRKK
ncbi:MAG: hypothetical protein U0L04_05060 [Bacteroidaceae bacterium]|nr:hypothetical protein [Bacteroidaceae bacterium]